MEKRLKTWVWILAAGLATGIFLGNQNKFMDTDSASCNWYTPGGWCPTVFSWKWFLGGLGIFIMLGLLIDISSSEDDDK
jgi:hypothetical protein